MRNAATTFSIAVILGLTATAVVTVTGCSNRKAIEKAESLADKACACTTPACFQSAKKEFVDAFERGTKGTKEDSELIGTAYGRLLACEAPQIPDADQMQPERSGIAPKQ